MKSPLGYFLFSSVLFLTACAHEHFKKVGEFGPDKTELLQLKLAWSNVFLIKGKQLALVDAGTGGDWDNLNLALKDLNLSAKDIKIVLLTHGHADHAGLAKRLQDEGAEVYVGHGDIAMLARGTNDELKPTNFMARLLKPMVDQPFEPITRATEINSPAELNDKIGAPIKVLPIPGHTPGSVVIILGNDQALVGDMMLGGSMGGVIFSSSAGEHYYQDDLKKNHENIRQLLGLGIQKFYLGHGGPVLRSSVERWIN
jgi:hydroxyacylglutathione hydrolase